MTPPCDTLSDAVTCDNCEGAGWQLWMDRGSPKFLRCLICLGERTVIFVMGALPKAPLTEDIILSRAQSQWMRS